MSYPGKLAPGCTEHPAATKERESIETGSAKQCPDLDGPDQLAQDSTRKKPKKECVQDPESREWNTSTYPLLQQLQSLSQVDRSQDNEPRSAQASYRRRSFAVVEEVHDLRHLVEMAQQLELPQIDSAAPDL